ncbi:NAD(P)/FAD-dependent oxidoreductase [Chitinibacter sp. S2-10]|uniref:NAD(P)/FAD-dependent oxidoreductase n=1 Tax=Chitinibacter sp. S2-10 TaxID=3373597 RepID=UPI00397733BA
MNNPLIVIGSGLAAYTLARDWRKLDTATPLVIISRDHAGFYSKPMLSNALGANKSVQQLLLKPAEVMASELDARIIAQTEVLAIDAAQRTITLSHGETLEYRDLVLALGADPIRLNLAGNASDQVISVNDLDDFGHFLTALDGVPPAGSVAILGGGLIGCEFANDLLARGIKPVVIDPAASPLSRLLPARAGEYLAERLGAAGVDFRLGVSASSVDTLEQGYVVTLSDGSVIAADLVLSAVGLRPRTALASAAGLQCQRGIVLDAQLQSRVEHVYAIGDCAEIEGQILPFILPILHQARVLAQSLFGTKATLKYPVMPVVVKTPACPTVVLTPAAAVQGEWQFEMIDDGMVAQFVDAAGVLQGFALLGAATHLRQSLLTRLAAA